MRRGIVYNSGAMPTPTAITLSCRATLASLRTGSRRVRDFSPAAVRHLKVLGLVSEHTAGLLVATHRAKGYCSDPSSFEA